jgi:hypothetical protein
MRAGLLRHVWVFVLCAAGCGSATLVRDSGTDGAGDRAGAGGSGGHPLGGGPAQAGAGGSAAGAGGSVSQGGAGGAAVGGAGAAGAGGTAGAGGGTGAGGTAGAGGAAGAAGAAGGSAGGVGGAGGGPTCANTTTDASNCGTCGHSCLGGTCSAGICQPFTLGAVATDYPQDIFVVASELYVYAVATTQTNDLWSLSATTPSTPTTVAGVPPNASLGCIMDGKLFWASSGSPEPISSCTLSNCAATTQAIITTMGDYLEDGPDCDTANDQLVWVTSSSNGFINTIYRASSSGATPHSITSFNFSNDGATWVISDLNQYFHQFGSGRTDRLFYSRSDSTDNTGTLYYVSTTLANTSSIPVATVSYVAANGNSEAVLANDTLVIADGATAAVANELFSAPLPNGVVSGTPPLFLAGETYGGVIDETNFYGTVMLNSTVPSDALISCPLTDCTVPTIISRGQAGAANFVQDSSAIYWTTPNTTNNQGFSVWKAAK